MALKNSAFYPGLHVMTFFYKMAGCPYIDTIYGADDTQSRLLVRFMRKFLRGAYLFICICMSLGPVLTYLARRILFPWYLDPITAIIRTGLYLVVYIQITVSFLNLTFRSGQLSEIFETAAKLEPKLHIDRTSVRRRMLKVSILCLLYVLLDACKYITGLSVHIPAVFQLLKGHSDYIRWLYILAYIVGCILVAAWYNVAVWHIVFFAEMFREYFAALGNRLELELKQESQAQKRGATVLSTEGVRLNLVAIQRLLRSVNSFIGVEVLCFYAVSVFYLCATFYSTAISEIGIFWMIVRVAYATILSAGLAITARAASRMSDEAARILCIIQAAKFEALTDAETHRVVGAVITYTIVLIQTNEGVMGPKCVNG
ncbi:hypothetical protein HPB48_019128 [Haemaphysalis longicornis]|uniref:Gustatory receptor n=1 Tax=Haemaphysalis longicornis TaxID=44386 RepID=A0A9J6GZI5_HAELO|nr:hypothetical protein HPB48_019128 [Haemaphysalis longicornis]